MLGDRGGCWGHGRVLGDRETGKGAGEEARALGCWGKGSGPGDADEKGTLWEGEARDLGDGEGALGQWCWEIELGEGAVGWLEEGQLLRVRVRITEFKNYWGWCWRLGILEVLRTWWECGVKSTNVHYV